METDTWPGTQPLLRWALRQLPAGGTTPEWREWTQREIDGIARAFLTSPLARDLEPDDEVLVDHLLWYGTGYGSGDPYRWGPPRVEILLLDWVPRKIIAPFEDLERMPLVAKAFIRWAHDSVGISVETTAGTLDVLDECTPEYLEAIADDDRPQGAAAVLAAMDLFGDDVFSYERIVREEGVRAVGSEEVYEALDEQPLPDEPLDLRHVAADVRERVERIATMADRVCTDHLGDVELRTACRRFLADVAAADPAIFRRRSKDETAAGAVCWIVAKANRRLGHGDTAPMLAALGLTGSVSQRAQPMLAAIGVEEFHTWHSHLGSPRYLTSARRRDLIERRERFRTS
jgi:hypothetical protein